MVIVELREEIKDIDVIRKLDLIEVMIENLKKNLLKEQAITEYDSKYISIIADKIIKVLKKIFYLLDIQM